MTSRRTILKIMGASLFSILSGRASTSLARSLPGPARTSPPRLRENVFADVPEGNTPGRALVGVAGSGGVEEMINEAVSLIGGFGRLDIKGRKVLVKPNVVSGEPHPTTTNPDVVGAVVKILYEHGASQVYVGDMSALATFSTLWNMKRCGIKKAAQDNGAKVIVFEDYDWVGVDLPHNRYVKKAYVTEWIYNVDLVINLPVVKTHRSATYSITLKNFIGCTHLKQRPYIIDPGHWEEVVAEFNSAYSPDLNIVDGTVSMIEGGPWSGTPAGTNLIIAGADRVAADIVGLGIIKSYGRWGMVTGKDVWDQRQIRTAVERGVGRGKDGIRLVTGHGDARFTKLMGDVGAITGLMT